IFAMVANEPVQQAANSKSEYRATKRGQVPFRPSKRRKMGAKRYLTPFCRAVLYFGHWYFEFVLDFGFRYSDFSEPVEFSGNRQNSARNPLATPTITCGRSTCVSRCELCWRTSTTRWNRPRPRASAKKSPTVSRSRS